MIGSFSGNSNSSSIPISGGGGLNSSAVSGSTGLNFSLSAVDGKSSGSSTIGINVLSSGASSFNKSKSFHKSNSGLAKKVI